MSLFNQVQTQRQALRKDAAQVVGLNVLTLLVGELETVSKRDGSEITDEKVIAGVKKIIKGNEETLRLKAEATKGAKATDEDAAKGEALVAKLNAESDVLRALLPVELSEAKLLEILESVKPGNIGEAMKHLNGTYAGQFDKGLASKVAKQYLS